MLVSEEAVVPTYAIMIVRWLQRMLRKNMHGLEEISEGHPSQKENKNLLLTILNMEA